MVGVRTAYYLGRLRKASHRKYYMSSALMYEKELTTYPPRRLDQADGTKNY